MLFCSLRSKQIFEEMRGDDKEINLNCPNVSKFPKMKVK